MDLYDQGDGGAADENDGMQMCTSYGAQSRWW